MSVTFSSMEEENKMPYNETWNKIYKVYIPEAFVEVMACEVITYSIEEDEKELIKYGEGKFLNKQFKNVKILEVLRFQREESTGEKNTYISSTSDIPGENNSTKN